MLINKWAAEHYPLHMEIWREIPGFPGYEASTFGNLRTYWYRVRNKVGRGSHRERWDTPRSLPSSPKECGHLHTNLYCDLDGKRYTRCVQVLIAITFLPFPDDFEEVDYTVDHINSGEENKRNNSVWNLQWLSRSDNIKKAYRDGACDNRIRRQRKAIMLRDMWTNEWTYCESVKEAAHKLGVDQSTISHALNDGHNTVSHYIVEYAGREDILLYGTDYYDYNTGEYY